MTNTDIKTHADYIMTPHICDKTTHCIVCELNDNHHHETPTKPSNGYSTIAMGLMGLAFTGIIAYNCYKWWK